MILAVFSDRLQHRFAFVIIGACLCLTGFAILRSVHDRVHLEYGAIFMSAMGVYSIMPIVICWVGMNRESLI